MSVPLCWIFIRRLGSVFQGPAAPSISGCRLPCPGSVDLPELCDRRSLHERDVRTLGPRVRLAKERITAAPQGAPDWCSSIVFDLVNTNTCTGTRLRQVCCVRPTAEPPVVA